MQYHTFLWFDWVLLAALFSSFLLAFALNGAKSQKPSIYGAMLALVFFLLLVYGVLFWDVFPLALCFEFLSLYYFGTVIFALAKDGKSGVLEALNAFISAFLFVKSLLLKKSKK